MRDYPFMTGTVADEGLYITNSLYSNSSYQSVKQALDKSIELSAKYYLSPDNVVKFRKIIDDFYFKESELSIITKEKLLENYTKFPGDTQFIYPNSQLINKMAEVSKKPFYSYVFGYQGEENQISLVHWPVRLQKEDKRKQKNRTKGNIGVTHADDILYLFSSESQGPIDKTDEYIINLIIDLWTSFAIKGKPTSDLLDVPNLWEPYVKHKRFLQIGCVTNNTIPSVSLRKNYFSDRINFWKDNFPLLKV